MRTLACWTHSAARFVVGTHVPARPWRADCYVGWTECGSHHRRHAHKHKRQWIWGRGTSDIDGVESPTYPIESSTAIRLPVQPHGAGTVDVAVINRYGLIGTLVAGFRYEDSTGTVSPGPPPSIRSVFPSAGITGGGTDAQISGTGFQPE